MPPWQANGQRARTERGQRGTLYTPFHIAEGLSGHEDCFAVWNLRRKRKPSQIMATGILLQQRRVPGDVATPCPPARIRYPRKQSASSCGFRSQALLRARLLGRRLFRLLLVLFSVLVPHHQAPFHTSLPCIGIGGKSEAKNFPVAWRIRHLPALSRARFPLI
jgi:hypothetical protein